MINRKIYNSSNKQKGEVNIYNDKVDIIDFRKKVLTITDKEIVEYANNPVYSDNIIIKLFDDYLLTIGEIAALSNVLYHRANKWINNLPIKTGKNAGRRNSSHEKIFSPERKKKIVEKRKEYYQKTRTPYPNYIRTDEIKEKIRQGVKKAIKEGRLDESSNARKGWINQKFANIDFKRGIGGYITSHKIHKRFFFRSLLELCYIIMLEEDPNIVSYSYEPFQITCDDGSLYTPDFQIGNDIIELKSYNFIYKQKGEIQKKFEYKKTQAEKYCLEHGLNYKVIFDTDIGFDSKRFKHILKETNYIQKYDIEFLQANRVRLQK